MLDPRGCALPLKSVALGQPTCQVPSCLSLVGAVFPSKNSSYSKPLLFFRMHSLIPENRNSVYCTASRLGVKIFSLCVLEALYGFYIRMTKNRFEVLLKWNPQQKRLYFITGWSLGALNWAYFAALMPLGGREKSWGRLPPNPPHCGVH